MLPEKIEKLIKRADKASAFFEATQLAGFDHEEAGKIFGRPKGLGPKGTGNTGFIDLQPLSADLRPENQLQH